MQEWKGHKWRRSSGFERKNGKVFCWSFWSVDILPFSTLVMTPNYLLNNNFSVHPRSENVRPFFRGENLEKYPRKIRVQVLNRVGEGQDKRLEKISFEIISDLV